MTADRLPEKGIALSIPLFIISGIITTREKRSEKTPSDIFPRSSNIFPNIPDPLLFIASNCCLTLFHFGSSRCS